MLACHDFSNYICGTMQPQVVSSSDSDITDHTNQGKNCQNRIKGLKIGVVGVGVSLAIFLES